MADNFDLRKFLTENKLTKNTQLLNEAVTLDGKPVDVNSIEIDGIDTSDYPDFVDAYITYAEYEDGTPLTEEELMKLEDENYGIVGELIFDKQLYLEGKGEEEGTLNEDNLEVKKAARDLYTFLKNSGVNTTLGSNMGFGKKIGMKTPGQAEASIFYGETSNSGGQTLINISLRGMEDKVKEVENKFLTAFPNLEIVNGSKKAYHILSGDMTNPGAPIPGAVNQNFTVKEKTTAKGGLAGNTQQNVKENIMTKRDQYLTRLVENALGMQPSNDDETEFNPADNADEFDYRKDQYQGNMEEGEEMVNEKPLPKYENIEKLMQEIDKSTDEAAHKYKMEEMKRVADGLEKKATALEEGDNAEHIDQKKLKQMKKDIMSLRKGIEKMEKLGEKKFTKKETKQSKPAESLSEGNFDLKKFLIENKLTRDSRMLSEAIIDLSDTAVNLLMDKTKYATKPGSDKGVYVVYDLSKPKGKGSFGDDDSTQKVGYWWTKDSKYKANKFESGDQDTIDKLKQNK